MVDAAKSSLLGQTTGEMVLAISGGPLAGQQVRLAAQKFTIGSAPGCTLRLCGSRRSAVDCVVLRGQRGTVVRALSGAMRHNGRAFENIALERGDRLAVGPVEFEILELGSSGAASLETTVAEDPVRRRLDESRTHAKDRARRLIQTIRAQQQALDQLETHRGETLDRLAQLEAERDALFAEREQWSQQVDGLGNREQQLNQQVRDLADRCAEQKNRLDQYQNQLADVECRLAQSQQELDAARNHEYTAQQDQQHELAEQQQRLEALQQSLNEKQADLDRQWSELEQERQSLEQTREELQQRQNETEQAQTDGQRSIQSQREQLQRDCAELARSQTELEQSRAEWESQRSSQLEQIEQQRAELDEEIQELQRQREQLDQERSTWVELRDGQQAEMDRRAQALDVRQAELTEKSEQFETSRRTWETHNSERQAKLDRAATELEQRILEFDEQVARFTAEREASQQQPTTAAQTAEVDAASLEFESAGGSAPVSTSDVLASFGHQSLDQPDPSYADRPQATEAERADADSDEEDGDESISQYMTQLLQRVQGRSSHLPTSQPTPTIPASQPRVEKQKVANDKPLKLMDQETLARSRRAAPEQASDLLAMRELAQLSAEAALQTHRLDQQRRRFAAHLLIMTGGIVGGLLLWWFADRGTAGWYGGAACIVIGIGLGVQAVLTNYPSEVRAILNRVARRKSKSASRDPDTLDDLE